MGSALGRTTDGVSATDFTLSEATRNRLYEAGQDAAHAFLTLQAEQAQAQELTVVMDRAG